MPLVAADHACDGRFRIKFDNPTKRGRRTTTA